MTWPASNPLNVPSILWRPFLGSAVMTAMRESGPTWRMWPIRTVTSEPAWSRFAFAARERAEDYRLGAHAERLIGLLQGERKAA